MLLVEMLLLIFAMPAGRGATKDFTSIAMSLFCICMLMQGLSLLLWSYGKAIPPSAESATLLSAISNEVQQQHPLAPQPTHPFRPNPKLPST